MPCDGKSPYEVIDFRIRCRDALGEILGIFVSNNCEIIIHNVSKSDPYRAFMRNEVELGLQKVIN